MSELPDGWQWLRLEQLAAPEPNAITDGPFGSNLKTADYVADGEVRVIRLGNLGVGSFVDDNKSFVTQKKFSGLTKHEARGGDLVVAALAEPVGRCVEVPPDLGTAMVKADCVRVRVHPAFHHRYVMHALNSPDGLKRAEAAAHGIGRLRINLSDLRSLLVPVAPPREQRRIVAKLEALQSRSRRAREALDAVPPLLEKLRQSILAAAFRGDLTADWRAQNPNAEPAAALLARIRTARRKKWEEAELAKLKAKGKSPTDDKWKAKYEEPERVVAAGLPELPAGWCWASVEELASDEPRSIQSGPFGSSLLHSEFCAEGVLAIGIDNVRDGTFSMGAEHRISEAKYEDLRKYTARPGDVLVTVMATVGRCCTVPDDLEPAIITKHVYRVSPDRRLVVPDYLTHSIRGAPALRDAMKADLRGQTRPGINGEIIRALPVPLAPLAEQRFVLAALQRALDRERGMTALMGESARRLGELDSSVLARAFRGELVPQDPNDEPADITLSQTSTEPATSRRPRARRAKAAE